MIYTLKQFANMFNTTEYTIRYYTDINILPCQRDKGNRRIFNEESINWMQGIICLKGCGASIEDIKEYCDLCLLQETKETLQKRYQIILKQKEQAYKRMEEAQRTADYMDKKVKHYQQILSGSINDDSNPQNWTKDTRPESHLILESEQISNNYE